MRPSFANYGSSELLARYVRTFSTLHRNHNSRLGAAPHKPILLLAILDCIERGSITENVVVLTPELVATFHTYWRALVPENTWSDKIVYPFRYLVHEKFWQLVKNGVAVSATELGHPTSIGQFQTVVDSGKFSEDLWELLQEKTAREVLRKTLLDTYFANTALEEMIADPLAAEAERLIEEARKTRFRRTPTPKVVRESDGAYLRHRLFPQVVADLYDHRCAVCRLGVRDNGNRTLVEAAHIQSFALFGNDDPRNGLALCPNHHRGFDAGWFTITAHYTLQVSPRLRSGTKENGTDYVHEGATVQTPSNSLYAPALDALAWHEEHIFQR